MFYHPLHETVKVLSPRGTVGTALFEKHVHGGGGGGREHDRLQDMALISFFTDINILFFARFKDLQIVVSDSGLDIFNTTIFE